MGHNETMQVLRHEQVTLKGQFIAIDWCLRYEELLSRTEAVGRQVEERKGAVLRILLEAGESMLDNQTLVSALKEAKAKVFELQNDLSLELKALDSIESCLPEYQEAADRLASFIHSCLKLNEEDQSFSFAPAEAFREIRQVDQSDPRKMWQEVMSSLTCRLTLSLQPKLRHQLRSFTKELSTKSEDLGKQLIKEVLEMSSRKPVLLLEGHAYDHVPAVDFVFWLALSLGANKPKLVVLDESREKDELLAELNEQIKICGKAGRWLIATNAETLAGRFARVVMDGIGQNHRVFLAGKHEAIYGRGLREHADIFSLVLPAEAKVRSKILQQLFIKQKDSLSDRRMKKKVLRLHLSLSELSGTLHSLKCVEILMAKTMKRKIGPKELLEIVKTVYGENAGRHLDDVSLAVLRGLYRLRVVL